MAENDQKKQRTSTACFTFYWQPW